MMMQQEVTKLARCSAVNIGVFVLPRLPGVEPLSVHEIHSDLCELQRIMSPTNTDSDSSSVESDEVIDSHYPVKPRRTIRTYEREEIVPELERPETSPEVEEALKMLHLMSHANRDVFDLEAGREALEGTFESYKLRTLRNSALYKEAKSAHEAYLRVLQGILIRTLQIQHSQQHLLHHLSAVQSALKGWRQYSEHLTHLSQLSSSSSTVTTTNTAQTVRKTQATKGKVPTPSNDSSAAILCLSPSSDNMPIPLIISNGSKVQTAYGPALVNNLNINTGTATLQLPYGAMTASLITVRDWCHDEIQRLLLSSLCQTNNEKVSFDNHDYLSSSVLSLSAQQPGGVVSSDEEDKESNQTDALTHTAAVIATHAETTDDDRRALLHTEANRKDLLRPAFLAALAPDADALNQLATLATTQNKRIDLTSLQGEPRYLHSGNGQPVSRLRADLNKLKNEQQGLTTLRNQLEQQLVNRRREIARISMASAALRLRMFTRRYCHRSSLAAKGVPLPPQPVQVYVAHHAKPASLPRALKEVMSMNLANSNNSGGEGMMGALAMAADLHRNIRPSAALNASQGTTDDLNQSVGQRRARRQLVTHDDSAMDDDDSAVGAVSHKKRVRDEDGTSNNNPRKK
jgi:hypothetical protein